MRKFFFIILLFLGIQCTSDQEVPEQILSQEQMVSFLIDLHKLEGEVMQLKVKRDSTRLVFKYFENRLFEKHQIIDSVYLESWIYYSEHPKQLEQIYEAVLDSLSLYDRLLQDK